MRVGIGTLAAGRERHLQRQAEAVRQLAGVARYVIVTMDGRITDVPGAKVIGCAVTGRGLPLAAARNRAVDALADLDLVVMLDADCIPSRELIGRYAAAARAARRPSLLCGPVGYLDELERADRGPTPGQRAAARRRVRRPFPTVGSRRELRHELFWSVSFAVTPATHARIGGFDEGYRGYGAEDTDYGMRARQRGVELRFVAGAWAYHQGHPPSAPAAVADVAANARRFHARWGWWPMPDHLAAFAAAGQIEWSASGADCVVLETEAPRQLRARRL